MSNYLPLDYIDSC